MKVSPDLPLPASIAGARFACDPWLAGILLAALLLCTFHLSWGLPNGNDSWAADSLGPVTVLGLVQRSFASWNSGFFYFKYPLAWPFEMLVAYAPYLGFLCVTGRWQNPSRKYPYGFEDPERALFVLAMIGRILSVAFILGTVALAYAIARRLFGRTAARLAAWFTATCYPLVYYAHTTNLDAGYLFWLILALYCAIVASENKRFAAWAGLGVAAAMTVSTKEQGFAFLLPLPLLVIGAHVRRGGFPIVWGRPVVVMAGAAVFTIVLANNVWYNPLGFVARIAYLLGRPLQPIEARLAPVEFAWFKGEREFMYLNQAADGLESGLGWPLALTAAAGLLVALRQRRPAIWLAVPFLGYYYLSLRGLELITLRYVLPGMVVGAILAGGVLASLMQGRAKRVGVALVVALCALGGARAAEINYLLYSDPRYRAEEWIAANFAFDARAEYYQKPTYLPRLRGRVEGRFIAPRERTLTGLAQRKPDLIVLSSASRKSVTHVWSKDWRSEHGMLTPLPPAIDMLEQIESGRAGYVKAARFSQSTFLLRSRITSLSPEITVYVRTSR